MCSIQEISELGRVLELDETTVKIGRGPFLGVTEKRVSRHHATLKRVENGVQLESIHINPCFYSRSSEPENWLALQEGESVILHPEDRFSLLPKALLYKVVRGQISDESSSENHNRSTRSRRKRENSVKSPKDPNVDAHVTDSTNTTNHAVQKAASKQVAPASKNGTTQSPAKVFPTKKPTTWARNRDDSSVDTYEENGKRYAFPLKRKRKLPDWMLNAKASCKKIPKMTKPAPKMTPKSSTTKKQHSELKSLQFEMDKDEMEKTECVIVAKSGGQESESSSSGSKRGNESEGGRKIHNPTRNAFKNLTDIPRLEITSIDSDDDLIYVPPESPKLKKVSSTKHQLQSSKLDERSEQLQSSKLDETNEVVEMVDASVLAQTTAAEKLRHRSGTLGLNHYDITDDIIDDDTDRYSPQPGKTSKHWDRQRTPSSNGSFSASQSKGASWKTDKHGDRQRTSSSGSLSGSQNKGFGSKTPKHGDRQRTPSSGSLSGSQTKGFGSKTPKHGDRQRTPSSGSSSSSKNNGARLQTPKHANRQRTPSNGSSSGRSSTGAASGGNKPKTAKHGDRQRTPNNGNSRNKQSNRGRRAMQYYRHIPKASQKTQSPSNSQQYANSPGGSGSSQSSSSQREPCGYGSKCYRKNLLHFHEFSHPGDADYVDPGGSDDDDSNLPECPYGMNCYRKNPLHKKQFRHSRRVAPQRNAKQRPQKASSDEDDKSNDASDANTSRPTRKKKAPKRKKSGPDDESTSDDNDFDDSFLDDDSDDDVDQGASDEDDEDWDPSKDSQSQEDTRKSSRNQRRKKYEDPDSDATTDDEDLDELVADAKEFSKNKKMWKK